MCRYPDILTAQLQYLYQDGRMAEAMPHIQEKIKLAVQGQLPHSETILCSLLAKLSEVLILESPGRDKSAFTAFDARKMGARYIVIGKGKDNPSRVEGEGKGGKGKGMAK